ncbi:VanZ family protein [Streptomyces sp. NBC_01142]|nr:VanZ family protein [Streptomyces sp. NBC_01142]
MCAAPTALVCRARKRPVLLPVLLAVAVAGILTVTLLPSSSGVSAGQCDVGLPRHVLTSSSALLNVALFVPGAGLGVLLWRRPVTVAASFMIFSGWVEFVQAVAPVGRSCSITDITANVMGTLIGAALGATWIGIRQHRFHRPGRDLAWGAALAVVGAAVLAGLLLTQTQTVDTVATDDQHRAQVDGVDGSEEWIKTAATAVFGEGTHVGQTSAELSGRSRSLITASTNRGTISGWWPDRTLIQAWSSDNQGDPGNVTAAEATKIANGYAKKWLPQSIARSKQQIRTVGDGPDSVYVVTYRRYFSGIMMPMRLDLTVTRAGRILGFTSRPERDPVLPEPAITEFDAKRLAGQQAKGKASSALLLAQRVGGNWRPVWLIGVNNSDVFLDAVTGLPVQPDKQSESAPPAPRT